jgi:hypothetical protein
MNIAADVAKLRDWFDQNGDRLDADPSLIREAYPLIEIIQAPRLGSPDAIEASALDLIDIIANLAVAIGAIALLATVDHLAAEQLGNATPTTP